jgi:hypothetical protein
MPTDLTLNRRAPADYHTFLTTDQPKPHLHPGRYYQVARSAIHRPWIALEIWDAEFLHWCFGQNPVLFRVGNNRRWLWVDPRMYTMIKLIWDNGTQVR